MATKEWKIIHKNHAAQALGEIAPQDLTYTWKLDQVGTISYGIPLGHFLAYEGYTRPYATDWELHYGTSILGAGLHTDAGITDPESNILQVTGKEWSHYFEKLFWPFDPTNPVASLYLASQKDLFLVLKDILDTSLAQSGALDFTYALAAIGALIDYQVVPIDTESIWSKINSLSTTSVGFDWKVNYDRSIIFASPFIGSQSSIKLSQGKNIINLAYTNHGPTATQLLVTGTINGATQALVIDSPQKSTFRLLQNAVDFGDIASTTLLSSRGNIEAQNEVSDLIEFTCDVVLDETGDYDYTTLNVGDQVHVDGYISPNGQPNDHSGQRWYYKYINDWYRLVGIQGTVSNDKLVKLSLTLDDASLSL